VHRMNRYVGAVIWRRSPPQSSYINLLPVVRYLKENERINLNSSVTFLVGENGIGKSTLLEAIAINAGFNPEGGTKNFNFSTRDTHSDLCDCIALAKYGYPKDGFFLRAESVYNVASNIEDLDEEGFGRRIIDSYGGRSLHKQSHGESFLSIMENRFGGNGLYILDEPEAALSPMRLMRLMIRINELVKENSQFIISTHSPILMTYPGAEILELNEQGLQSVTYKETEHYQMTLRYLQNPEKMLRYLLGNEEESLE